MAFDEYHEVSVRMKYNPFEFYNEKRTTSFFLISGVFCFFYFIYTYVFGLKWFGYSPIAQILSIQELQHVTYSDIFIHLTSVPPLLSILRKLSVDTGFPITYFVNIVALFLSTLTIFKFVSDVLSNAFAYSLAIIYLAMPSIWLFATYEYDPSLFVLNTSILKKLLSLVLFTKKIFLHTR